jgi:hypothetical protein
VLEVLISVDGSNWCELSVACFDFEGDVRMVFYTLGNRGWGGWFTKVLALGGRGDFFFFLFFEVGDG